MAAILKASDFTSQTGEEPEFEAVKAFTRWKNLVVGKNYMDEGYELYANQVEELLGEPYFSKTLSVANVDATITLKAWRFNCPKSYVFLAGDVIDGSYRGAQAFINEFSVIGIYSEGEDALSAKNDLGGFSKWAEAPFSAYMISPCIIDENLGSLFESIATLFSTNTLRIICMVLMSYGAGNKYIDYTQLYFLEDGQIDNRISQIFTDIEKEENATLYQIAQGTNLNFKTNINVTDEHKALMPYINDYIDSPYCDVEFNDGSDKTSTGLCAYWDGANDTFIIRYQDSGTHVGNHNDTVYEASTGGWVDPKYRTITLNTPLYIDAEEKWLYDIFMENQDVAPPIATISTGAVHSMEMPNVIIKLQDKEVTQNGEYTADEGFDGLAKVTVNVEGGGSGGLPDGVNVTFKSDGQDYMLMSVLSGNSVPEPVTPEKEGGYCMGWSTTEESGALQQFPFAPLEDTTLYAQWKSKVVIGFTGLTNESGKLTWTDDIANFEKWSTSVSGGNIIVTSPLDNVFPFSEIHEVTDDEGNVFVSFPKMYMKWITDSSGNIDGVKFSNEAIDDDSFISDAFLDPRNNGEYLDEVWIGKYEASGTSSKMYSKSGSSCLVDITRANFRKAARAYGDSGNAYNGYQQYDIAMLTLYNFLCMLYYKTANIQTVFAGRTSDSSKSDTGTCDTISGLNGWNTASNCVKMLGVENPYGNIYKWVDGIVFSGSTIYAQKSPTVYSDSTGGNTFGFSRPTSSNYIKYLKAGSNATKSLVYCSSTGGSSTTYVGDYCYYSSSGTVLCSGGDWNDGAYAGLWCRDGSGGASTSYSSAGGRLCRRPLK